MVGRLDGIGSVADVTADLNAEVSADGSWGGVSWLGGSEHLTAHQHDVGSFPNHAHDWSRVHVFDKSSEESLRGQISIVLLQMLLSWHGHLHSDQLVTTGLETCDDLSDLNKKRRGEIMP